MWSYPGHRWAPLCHPTLSHGSGLSRHAVGKQAWVLTVFRCRSPILVYHSLTVCCRKVNVLLPLVSQSCWTTAQITCQPWHPMWQRKLKLRQIFHCELKFFDPFKFCEDGKKSHGRRSRHLENRVDPGNGVSFSLLCRGSFSGGGKTKIAGKGERPEKWKIGGAQRKTGIPRAPRFASFQAPRAYFSPLPISQPVRREDQRGLCGGERGWLCLQAAQKPGSQKQTGISFSPQSRFSPQSLFPHSGQTHWACAVPAKSAPYKRPQFPKSFAIMPNVKTVTEKLRFIHHLYIGNLINVIHCASQLELFFQNAIYYNLFPTKVSQTFASNFYKLRGSENRK